MKCSSSKCFKYYQLVEYFRSKSFIKTAKMSDSRSKQIHPSLNELTRECKQIHLKWKNFYKPWLTTWLQFNSFKRFELGKSFCKLLKRRIKFDSFFTWPELKYFRACLNWKFFIKHFRKLVGNHRKNEKFFFWFFDYGFWFSFQSFQSRKNILKFWIKRSCSFWK